MCAQNNYVNMRLWFSVCAIQRVGSWFPDQGGTLAHGSDIFLIYQLGPGRPNCKDVGEAASFLILIKIYFMYLCIS